MEYRKGNKILSIEQDENPESPRTWDNLGTMMCFHRQYSLGDKHELKSSDFNGWDEIEEYLIQEEKAVVILPLYLYDHSGLRMKVGSFAGMLPQGHARFDTMRVGFIYATKDALKDWTDEQKNMYYKGATDKQILERLLQGEVIIYDQYLMGDIYGFTLSTVKTCDLGYEHREVENSCWGFYGSDFENNGLFASAGITDIEDWEKIEE